MNIYKISQTANNEYDTFDSAIVAAESEDDARLIHPSLLHGWEDPKGWAEWCASPEDVTVELIGTARDNTERGVILASFNAS